MRTYTTRDCIGRLVAHLVAYGKPFHFDGDQVEFTATAEFVQRMRSTDKVLATVSFVIR